jgi:hypothetical protein
VRMSGSIGCATQMPSSVTANLLDDGVVDTLGLVGAMSGVHTSVSIDALDRARIASRSTSPILLFEKPVNKHLRCTTMSIDFSSRVAGQHPGTVERHRGHRYSLEGRNRLPSPQTDTKV